MIEADLSQVQLYSTNFQFVGYGATCVALLLSATTILKETDKLPNNGGVLAPGACFRNTNLVSNLCKNGFTFEVISAKEESKADE